MAPLPIGNEQFESVRVSTGWCQVLNWGGNPFPTGVELTITSVDVQTPGAAPTGEICGAPSCAGATATDQGGFACSVGVDPGVVDGGGEPDSVDFSLSGTFTCPDQPLCDAVNQPGGILTILKPPPESPGTTTTEAPPTGAG